MLRPGEQRGLLETRLQVDGRELVFMTTHIDYRPDNTERLLNVGELGEASRRAGPLAAIVCGDFNDTPEGAVHLKMKEIFDDAWESAGQGDGFSFSAEKPRKRIDYIWVSKNGAVKPLRLWVPNTEGSDHLPVVGEFQLR